MNVGGPLGPRAFGIRLVWLVPVLAGFFTPAAIRGQSGASPGEITFTKDIAPILQRSCQPCHRPDGVAPMPLVTYEQVRPWAREMKMRTSLGPKAGVMPPWLVEKDIGIQKFKNDPSLTDAEIATIVKWADSGAPRGNPADMPPAPQFASNSEWQFKPDLVIKYPAYKVAAAGPDLFGNLYAEIPITKDRYIKAIQTRAGDAASRKVVHHALSYAVDDPNNDTNGDDSVGVDGGQFLVE